ncbi:MAG: geranylgeranylglyceryl/heptaprenylglyceryl phosphate synthase [Euryarchaeota archaeon]|nr:geranylgeranylglyceryl/heptaprenylglyceryl phosphate synthase [Euryarchaeota archaeon]
MKVLEYISDLVAERKAHFTLIDPDKQSPERAGEIAALAVSGGSDAIMVGGSAGIDQHLLDETVKAVKRSAGGRPVILFPGDVTGVSRHADAIFFMSLLNSRNPYYITGAQAIGAPAVKRAGIEPIPMGYIIVEPGGAVGWVGDARAIPRSKPQLAAGYALAAQYLGMRLVYLEAGSGAAQPVPEEMVLAVRRAVDVPVIVGGGIRSGEDAYRVAKAGADIIVTGTAVESAGDVEAKVREFVEAIARV